jgi:hypothetical protein
LTKKKFFFFYPFSSLDLSLLQNRQNYSIGVKKEESNFYIAVSGIAAGNFTENIFYFLYRPAFDSIEKYEFFLNSTSKKKNFVPIFFFFIDVIGPTKINIPHDVISPSHYVESHNESIFAIIEQSRNNIKIFNSTCKKKNFERKKILKKF